MDSSLTSVLTATAVTYVILFIVGMCMALLASQLQCSKIGAAASAKEGAIWATVPAGLYGLLSYFPILRNPFANTLVTYAKISPENADWIGTAYVSILGGMIMSVWLSNTIRTDVCQPSVAEMNAFKAQLMAELKEKQDAIEENEKKKPTS